MDSNDRKENNIDMEKFKVHFIVEIVQYVPNAVVSKTITRKAIGNITIFSFDTGEEMAEKTSAFDTYIQIMDGTAEIVLGGQNHQLKLGQVNYYPSPYKKFLLRQRTIQNDLDCN